MKNCINNTENKREYFKIFNRDQALFYIRGGAEISGNNINVNSKSGNVYFRFKNNDRLQELFSQWCNK